MTEATSPSRARSGLSASAPETVQSGSYQPHAGDCCECVPRLRQQNKQSADAWHKRTGDLVSEVEGSRALMRRAFEIHNTQGLHMSVYGQAAIAAALKEAEDARAEAEAWKEQALRERRTLIMFRDDWSRRWKRDYEQIAALEARRENSTDRSGASGA